MAYQSLAWGGPRERALFKAIGTFGASGVADRLGRDADEVRAWVLAGKVPEGVDLAALGRNRWRRGGLPEGYADPRRSRLADVEGLSFRRAAEVLGVSHVTVMRWRRATEAAACAGSASQG